MKKINRALLAVIALGTSQLSANDNIYTMSDFTKSGRLYKAERDATRDYDITNSLMDANLLSKSQTITILEDTKTEISSAEAAFSYKEAFKAGASYLAGIAGVTGAYYFGVPLVFWGVYKGTLLGLNLIGVTGFSAMSGATNLAVMAAGSTTAKTVLIAGCGAAAKMGTSLILDAADLLGKAAAGTYKLVGDYLSEGKSSLASAQASSLVVELSKEELRQKRLLKFDQKAAIVEPKIAPQVETLMDKTVETVKTVAKSAWSYLGTAYTALTEKLAPKAEVAVAA
ncbi:MAG: hypothetical protein K0M45_08170 [Candidatus Paracaedibacteraceae bacterium]|nr:hypothetical protein [Candidatus Paracaedibacteraceae bacterium]